MLGGLLVAYTIIIAFGGARIGDPARVVLLSYLLWTSARLHANYRWKAWAIGLGAASFAIAAGVAVFYTGRVVSGVIGGLSIVLISVCMSAIVVTLRLRLKVDATAVLGVLCVYLLFALLFASVHQLIAAFQQQYLNGVSGDPTASDLLYFSVVTLSTVGFGDITPATEAARAVSVAEALVGQLYLVSVVAAVVAGYRVRPHTDPDTPEQPNGPPDD